MYQRALGCTRSCAKSATSVVRSICDDGPENTRRRASVPFERKIKNGRLSLVPS